MRTLTEIAKLLAPLDNVEEGNVPQFEKALRNLVQRHYLPPSDQQGRVFLYDDAAIVAIRLAVVASDFGLPRASIETLTRWLFQTGERRVKMEGVSHAAEAVERVNAGENFALHLVMDTGRTIRVSADWSKKPASERVERALASRKRVEIARFSLPASSIIASLLPVLTGAN